MSDKEIPVRVQGVSKKFSRSLRQSVSYGIRDIARNIVGRGAHSDVLRPGEFWAVQDLSFELRRGEILGLIGSNGSGKSTTLKLLNGIFMPDRGQIEIQGRVGALIDVGVGFHPMLSGRENIYVSGAIHGLSRHEIDRRFDSIVEFSEIEEFIDTPVRFYSSGMYVRLGFSVAIHLNPDVLLIDEVLSVGDMAFGRKCFQRMNEILSSGITVVFVSHAIRHVERVCHKTLLLHHGVLQAYGDTAEVCKKYYAFANIQNLPSEEGIRRSASVWGKHVDRSLFEVTGVELLNGDGETRNQFRMLEPLKIRLRFRAHRKVKGLKANFKFQTTDGISVSSFSTQQGDIPDWSGPGYLECRIPELPLREGIYTLEANCGDANGSLFESERASEFSIIPDSDAYIQAGSAYGLVHIQVSWHFDHTEN